MPRSCWPRGLVVSSVVLTIAGTASHAEAARLLCIAEMTVKNHVTDVLKKLGLAGPDAGRSGKSRLLTVMATRYCLEKRVGSEGRTAT